MWIERWWYVLRLRVRSVLRREQVDRELDEELSDHIAQTIEEFRAKGLSGRDAETAALRRFGGVTQRREECRDERRLGWLDSLRADLLFALHMAWKTPWMTAVSVIALGTAMAVTIGGFSLSWNYYYAELPFEDGDRIVAVQSVTQPDPALVPVSEALFREWEAQQTSFDVIAAATARSQHVADGAGGVVRYPVATMTSSAFEMARVPPLHGRTLRRSDETPGATPVVVIGHRVWQSLFGGDPEIVGRTVLVDDAAFQVVGIMPDGFRFPVSHDLWVPMTRSPVARPAPPVGVFGRLAEGVSRDQAHAELEVIRGNYVAAHPGDIAVGDRITTVMPYVQITNQPDELVFGAFIFCVLILVVACASVSNLLLVRALARTRELAVRGALGASRRRLIAQLSIEALLLTTAGAVLGIGITRPFFSWFAGFASVEEIPFWFQWGVNRGVVLSAVASAFGAAVMAGVMPAIKATGVATHGVLKDGAGTSGMRFGAVSGVLTVVGLTVSVAFLAAAALAAQSVLVAGEVSRTLPTSEVLVADVLMADDLAASGEWAVPDPWAGADLTGIGVPAGVISPERWPVVQEELRAAVEVLPGVRSALLAIRLPGQAHRQARVELEHAIDGAPAPTGAQVYVSEVSPGLFDLFGATMLVGRTFGPRDTVGSEPVAVVNTSFARRFYGTRNPLGRRFRRVGDVSSSAWIRIVGVSSDLPMNPGTGRTDGYYLPFSQRHSNRFMLALHAPGDPLALAAAVKDTVKRIDPRMAVIGVESHEDLAARPLAGYQLIGLILIALGGTAAFLSVTGVYAVMAFAVTQRTREIGIRRALGANHRGILGVILRRGLVQVGAGILLGAAAGWGLLGLMPSLPTGFASRGGGVLLAAGALMSIAGLTACVVPAFRALAIHPVSALRQD